MSTRSTWIWVILFLAAVGTFLYLIYRPVEQEISPTPTPVESSFLFTETDGTLVGILVYDRHHNVVKFERPAGGLWSMVMPTPGPADQSLAEAGASQVVALLVVDTITGDQPLSSMGLEYPVSVFNLTFANGMEHRLDIGNSTPTGSGYYVRLDDGIIYIVSKAGIDALLNLLTSPPYLPVTSTPAQALEPGRSLATATATP